MARFEGERRAGHEPAGARMAAARLRTLGSRRRSRRARSTISPESAPTSTTQRGGGEGGGGRGASSCWRCALVTAAEVAGVAAKRPSFAWGRRPAGTRAPRRGRFGRGAHAASFAPVHRVPQRSLCGARASTTPAFAVTSVRALRRGTTRMSAGHATSSQQSGVADPPESGAARRPRGTGQARAPSAKRHATSGVAAASNAQQCRASRREQPGGEATTTND